SWGSASPAIRLAATAMPLDATSPAAAAPGSLFGGVPPMGPVGSIVNAPRDGEVRLRSRWRSSVLPPWATGPTDHDHTRGRYTPPHHGSSDDELAGLSEWDEIEQLRQQIAELAKERDVLKDTAALLLEEAQL
ncbi:MAG: PPE family protein, partial [Mycobacterium sp.]